MNAVPRGARISVIIPTLEEADQLPRLLTDLRGLRAQLHEIIVVDGGSQDATPTKALPDADQVLSSPPGRARQMNLGAQHARGDILWFVHADSRVAPQTVREIGLHSGNDITWGRFDVRLASDRWSLRVVEQLMNLRSRLSGIATGDQGIFVSRQLFERVGGFPDIPLMEDIALSKALRDHARPRCIRNPRLTTSSRRWEQRGVMRTIVLMWRLRLAYALGTPPERLARLYQ